MYLSDIAYTPNRVRVDLLRAAQNGGGAEEWLRVADALSARITFGSYPAALSDAPLDFAPDEQMSVMELIDRVMKAEQGYVYCTTTGTLTSPTDVITVRERARPTAVSYTFDAETELAEAPTFYRNVSNMVSRVEVEGAARNVNVYNQDVADQIGSASSIESVPLVRDGDLAEWGQDRIFRAEAPALWVESIVVDAMTTPTDRSADLLAMKQGDRIQITGLPSTQLGFTTWDGWLIGKEESHTISEHRFTLYLQATTRETGIFDTDRFASGGELTLTAGINAAVTSLSVSTTGQRLSTTEEPYTILIDDEEMTVSVCTTATPQVLTVTRGVNGTTAASHSAAATVEIIPPAVFAY
jgi:hypothetical protein